MRVGIPKGLLYYKYHPFLTTFFSELGAEIIVSEDTNKEILDLGVKYCVDDACLPIKIFHGHAASIKNKCDIMVIPRIMQLAKDEFICPKFCGLPEMINNSIDSMPNTISDPIYAFSKKSLYNWAKQAGNKLTSNKLKIRKAFYKALKNQQDYITGIQDEGFEYNIALAGHPYNIYESYMNMNLVEKLNNLGIGVRTIENIQSLLLDKEIETLYKKPFWTYFKENYAFSIVSSKDKNVDGIIYVSSFNCGIDSVATELIKNKTENFPFLILKLDEHTGEAGIDTRIEAFADMLVRRLNNESYFSTHG